MHFLGTHCEQFLFFVKNETEKESIIVKKRDIIACGFSLGNFFLLLAANTFSPKRNQEHCKIVEDFHPTENGEACQESHSASNEAKLPLQGHLDKYKQIHKQINVNKNKISTN